MKVDVYKEIIFKTARSGGKGGQNVNKVESMVEGNFHIMHSSLLSDAQKKLISEKLQNKINREGFLFVKSQVHPDQLSNKAEVVEKMNTLIASALKKKPKRFATKPTAHSIEKRITRKKKNSEIKKERKKTRLED